MPRPVLILPILAIAVAAAGCAGTGTNRYATELAELERTCTARGGILTPTGIGRTDGRPQTEYACRINDGGTRLRD